jgi:hypothetical protein
VSRGRGLPSCIRPGTVGSGTEIATSNLVFKVLRFVPLIVGYKIEYQNFVILLDD